MTREEMALSVWQFGHFGGELNGWTKIHAELRKTCATCQYRSIPFPAVPMVVCNNWGGAETRDDGYCHEWTAKP